MVEPTAQQAGRREREAQRRYYAVLESTARSPGGSPALTHHLEPPQTFTADLMIIGLVAKWHASNAHLPLVTAAPIAFLPRADSLCSHAGCISPLCRRLQLCSAQPSERHTLHNPQHFACFGLGSTIQKSTRGCSRQTKQPWLFIYTTAFATVSHPQTRSRIMPTRLCCNTDVAGLARSRSKGDAERILHGTMHMVTSPGPREREQKLDPSVAEHDVDQRRNSLESATITFHRTIIIHGQ